MSLESPAINFAPHAPVRIALNGDDLRIDLVAETISVPDLWAAIEKLEQYLPDGCAIEAPLRPFGASIHIHPPRALTSEEVKRLYDAVEPDYLASATIDLTITPVSADSPLNRVAVAMHLSSRYPRNWRQWLAALPNAKMVSQEALTPSGVTLHCMLKLIELEHIGSTLLEICNALDCEIVPGKITGADPQAIGF